MPPVYRLDEREMNFLKHTRLVGMKHTIHVIDHFNRFFSLSFLIVGNQYCLLSDFIDNERKFYVCENGVHTFTLHFQKKKKGNLHHFYVFLIQLSLNPIPTRNISNFLNCDESLIIRLKNVTRLNIWF